MSRASGEHDPLNNIITALPSRTQPHQTTSQATTPRHRPGYQRIPSISVIDERFIGNAVELDAEDDITDVAISSANDGLGITGASTPSKAKRVTIQPVGVESASSSRTSAQTGRESPSAMASPPSTSAFSGSTKYDPHPADGESQWLPSRQSGKRSHSSLQSLNTPSAYAISSNSEADPLYMRSAPSSVKMRYEEWAPSHHCQNPTLVAAHGRWSWLSIVLLILALYSTVLSGIFLGVALKGPRWGNRITSNGPLTISDANVIVAILSKTVELSFVSVFVAFLGQALARRASEKDLNNGVTLAELSMRNWITQPGTLLTHWESVRYAGITILGLLSLLACVVATLYTTACNSLVLPALSFNDWQYGAKQGLVKTSFANPQYIQSICQTPIGEKQDAIEGPPTCVQIEHAAMGYHNYFSYLNTWARVGDFGNGSSDLWSRPPGYALVHDNTTVIAPWIEQKYSNMTRDFDQYSIIVNNVTMAMPHAGVLQAASDPINHIVQPEEMNGEGVFMLHASVPSPMVNVLCATLTKEQISPLIYETWKGHNASIINYTTWPAGLGYEDIYLGQTDTPLGKVFDWGPDRTKSSYPPVFPKFPEMYNTMTNDTLNLPWGRTSIYILGAGGNVTSSGDAIPAPYDPAYSLCKMQVGTSPDCSTMYNASGSGGTLEAICEQPNDKLQYIKSMTNATRGNDTLTPDWANIGAEWSRSLSLNDGFLDGKASNARLLNQLMVVPRWSGSLPKLNEAQPSMAEALAVLAGCTLVQSSTDAPFVQFWNYTSRDGNYLEVGQYQYFNASIRAQEYASGGVTSASRGFFLVLFCVFILNFLVLAYFIIQRRWYPDFSEPQNLFNLAIQSPPSDKLGCEGRPRGEDYRVTWTLAKDESGHLLIKDMLSDRTQSPLRKRISTWTDQLSESPVMHWGKFSPKTPK